MVKAVGNHDKLEVQGKTHMMDLVIKSHLFNHSSTMLADLKSELRSEGT
jgi:hypothetical protein